MTTAKHALASFLVVATAGAIVPGSASANEWRFCVGVAPAAHQTIITDIFDSPAESAQVEHRLEAYFRARKGENLTFQCPRGSSEKYAALNDQTTALQFNREMGYSVDGFPATEMTALLSAGEF